MKACPKEKANQRPNKYIADFSKCLKEPTESMLYLNSILKVRLSCKKGNIIYAAKIGKLVFGAQYSHI